MKFFATAEPETFAWKYPPGPANNTAFRRYDSIAGYGSNSSTATGAIIFEIPVGFVNHMQAHEFSGYQYTATGGAWTARVSFYSASPGSVQRPTVTYDNAGTDPATRPQVRVGRRISSGNPVIIFGDTNSVWIYPKVMLTTSYLGYASIAATALDSTPAPVLEPTSLSAYDLVVSAYDNSSGGPNDTSVVHTTGAETITGTKTFQNSAGSSPLFLKARTTANGGQSGNLLEFTDSGGTNWTTFSNVGALNSLLGATVNGLTSGNGLGQVADILANSAQAATAGVTTQNSGTVSFKTSRWSGSASVDELAVLTAKRGSAAVGDYWLESSVALRAPSLVLTGALSVGGGTGTASQVMVSSGASAPTWQTLDLTYLPDSWLKKAVKAATTVNITLSGAQTVDGISCVAGDRVLVKNQTTASQNGIYTVATGAWTRSVDANTASEMAGASTSIDQGTQGGQIWSTTFKSTDTLGTTSMAWGQVLDSTSGLSLGNSIQTVTGSKYFTNTIAFGDLSGGTAGVARFNAVGPSDATTTTRNSGIVQFRTSYWSGTANVYEDQNLTTVRRSTTANDVYLYFPRDIVSGLTVDGADLTVSGRSIGRGVLSGGYAQIVANSANTNATATAVDISGLACTVTVAANRRIKITLLMHVQTTVANDRAQLLIREATATLGLVNGGQLVTVSTPYSQMFSTILTAPTAGVHTYKASFLRLAGTGTLTAYAANTAPSYLLVEDIGPST